MQLSDDGIKRLEQREGKRNRAYKDTKGIWTIGVGHTGPNVYEGLVWTDQQVDDALKADVVSCEECINKYVKVPLTQKQFDALVSFIFNIGVTHFITSTLLKDLNAGDYSKADDDFMMWTKNPELIPRREGEKEQFDEQ